MAKRAIINQIKKGVSWAVGFTKSEVRGVVLLIFIILVTSSLSIAIVKLIKSREDGIPDYSRELEAWVQEVESSYSIKTDKQIHQNSQYEKHQLNTKSAPKKEFTKAASSKEWVDRTPKKHVEKNPKEIIVLDLNKARADELQTIRGIGPTYSTRIVKYRDLLGGFYNLQQLNEVYGLDSALIDKIAMQFQIQSDVRPLNINSDSIKVLASHPYISYDLARVIVNFRKSNGDIKNASDLQQIKALNSETFEKIKPYLTAHGERPQGLFEKVK
jgi:competence ComEA-like helix-hairpin-helix protein